MMTQAYSDPSREADEHALPDIEVFELTAHEYAAQDVELIHDYMKRPEFRPASMNSCVREAMLDTIVRENRFNSGWFWQSCFPGCLPDGPVIGPSNTYKEALADAQSNNE